MSTLSDETGLQQRLSEAEEVQLLRQNHQLSVRVRALEAIIARRSCRAAAAPSENPLPAGLAPNQDDLIKSLRADLHQALQVRVPFLEGQLRRAQETIRLLKAQAADASPGSNAMSHQESLPARVTLNNDGQATTDPTSTPRHASVSTTRRGLPSKSTRASRTTGNLSSLPGALAAGERRVHFSEMLEDHNRSILAENNGREPTSVLKNSSRSPNKKPHGNLSLRDQGHAHLFVSRGPSKSQLSVFDSNGQFVKSLIPKAIEDLCSTIRDFDIDPQGNLYVVDSGNISVTGSGLVLFRMILSTSHPESVSALNLMYKLDGKFNRNFRRCSEKIAPESVVCWSDSILVTSDGGPKNQRLLEFDSEGVLRRTIADDQFLTSPRNLRLSSCNGEEMALLVDTVINHNEPTQKQNAIKCFRLLDGCYMGHFLVPFESVVFEVHSPDILLFAVPGDDPVLVAHQLSNWPDADSGKTGEALSVAQFPLKGFSEKCLDLKGLSFGPNECIYVGAVGHRKSAVLKLEPCNQETIGFEQSNFVLPCSTSPAPFRWLSLNHSKDRWETVRFRP